MILFPFELSDDCNTMSKYPRGSEWRKWDLHFHSPLSILNNQYPKLVDGTPNWDLYLEKLEALDIAVLGVTDYFTIDGYKVLKVYKEEGRLPKVATLLPNVEFRLKDTVPGKDGTDKRINLHVIFSDEVLEADIEEHFLHDLEFFFEGDPQNEALKRKLKVSNIEALGKKLKEDHEPFRHMGTDLEVGAMQAVVDIDDIMSGLNDPRFKGKNLVVLAARDWDKIKWDGQGHLIRKGLLQQSDQVFTSNAKDICWFRGEAPYVGGPEAYIKEFKTLKPCIHGSDAHRLEDLGRPCASRGDQAHNCDQQPDQCDPRFCWIKGDPTFEGLKELLYEPSDRVAIGAKNPAPIISNFSISRFTMGACEIADELVFDVADLTLNTGMVAIVGGKGAGKTALVDIIANSYVDRSNAIDTNSFVRRIAEYAPPLKTRIEFRDGAEFEKTLLEEKFVDSSQIVYIAQGELEQYIGDKSDLSRHITELILHSPRIENSLKSFEFETAIKNLTQREKAVDNNNKRLGELEERTDSKHAELIATEKNKIAADLLDARKRIEEFEQTQTDDQIKVAQEGQERLGNLKARREDLEALEQHLDITIAALNSYVGSLNTYFAKANILMAKLGEQERFAELTYSDGVKLAEVSAKVKANILELIPKIEAETFELENLDKKVKDHAKLLENRRQLEEKERIANAKAADFDLLLDELRGVETMRRETLIELYEAILAQKKAYDAIIETFSADKAAVLADIDFLADVRFDREAVLTYAEGVVDNRKIDVRTEFAQFLNLSQIVAKGDELKIDELVNEAISTAGRLRGALKGKPIGLSDLFDLIFRNYMTVVPVVKYKNTALDKLSLGQKATVLIKIYLAHGDKPIIIDSHDDHLDNEFIMEELVGAIRHAKKFRQVILVSNNGNVVINSDAEQIIIATRTEGHISYVSGSIEDAETRDLALKVLEGGHTAFRKRQEKYRLV